MKPSIDGKVSHEVGKETATKTWDDMVPKRNGGKGKTGIKVESMDGLTQKEKEELEEESKIFFNSAAARDKKGHSYRFVFLGMPQVHDQVTALLENLPQGNTVIKNESQLMRAIVTLGLNRAERILKYKGVHIKNFNKIMKGISKIGRLEREYELELSIKEHKRTVDDCTLPDKNKIEDEFKKRVPQIWEEFENIAGENDD